MSSISNRFKRVFDLASLAVVAMMGCVFLGAAVMLWKLSLGVLGLVLFVNGLVILERKCLNR